jgi:hypothetical protein
LKKTELRIQTGNVTNQVRQGRLLKERQQLTLTAPDLQKQRDSHNTGERRGEEKRQEDGGKVKAKPKQSTEDQVVLFVLLYICFCPR